MSSEILDPTRFPKTPKSLKAEKVVYRITFNPSSANPGETLFVTLPKLGNLMSFVPFSTFLLFDLEIEKEVPTDSIIQNVGRNLVENFKVIIGSKTIKDTDRNDLFEGYRDMLSTEEDMLLGIQEEDYRKIRCDSNDHSADAKPKVAHCGAYDSKYHIPLTHPILDGHGVFCQRGLQDDLKFELTLAKKSGITKTSDAAKKHSFVLKNIQLEYTTILSDHLASTGMELLRSGRTFLFEDVHLFKTIPSINLATQKDLAVQINDSRRCMKGALIMFLKNFAAGARDSEEFVNPLIDSMVTTIDGVPHKLFSDGMLRTDLWKSIQGRFKIGDHFKEKDFHSDKFALWLDFRASPDNSLHEDGEVVGRSSDEVRIDINWAGKASTVVTCFVFLVSDAAIFVKDGRLKEFLLK